MSQTLFTSKSKTPVPIQQAGRIPSRAELIDSGTKARVGRPPVGGALASWWSLLLSAGLIALGVVLLIEAAALEKIGDFSSWSKVYFAQPMDVAQPWRPVALGTGLGIVGLILVIAALKPRKRRAAAAGKDKLVWIDRSALREIVHSHIADVPGVDSYRVKVANARKIVIHAEQLPGAGSDVASALRKTALNAVSGLSPTPAIKVHVTRPAAS